jgi:dUTP pyrophosphatase
MDEISVHISLWRENAVLPAKGSEGAAGYDLYSTEDVILTPGSRHVVPTGISMKIPPTHYGRIAPRSGLAVRHGIDVGAGVVDSDYRGEIMVLLCNNGTRDISLSSGSRIAQIIFERISSPSFVVQSYSTFKDSDKTSRGTGGFGSTGISTLNYFI